MQPEMKLGMRLRMRVVLHVTSATLWCLDLRKLMMALVEPLRREGSSERFFNPCRFNCVCVCMCVCVCVCMSERKSTLCNASTACNREGLRLRLQDLQN